MLSVAILVTTLDIADGWTFDTEGDTDQSWVRHEGVKLQEADLERAIKLVRAWAEQPTQPQPPSHPSQE